MHTHVCMYVYVSYIDVAVDVPRTTRGNGGPVEGGVHWLLEEVHDTDSFPIHSLTHSEPFLFNAAPINFTRYIPNGFQEEQRILPWRLQVQGSRKVRSTFPLPKI